MSDKRMEANGHHYTNLASVTRALLDKAGERDMASNISPYMRSRKRGD